MPQDWSEYIGRVTADDVAQGRAPTPEDFEQEYNRMIAAGYGHDEARRIAGQAVQMQSRGHYGWESNEAAANQFAQWEEYSDSSCPPDKPYRSQRGASVGPQKGSPDKSNCVPQPVDGWTDRKGGFWAPWGASGEKYFAGGEGEYINAGQGGGGGQGQGGQEQSLYGGAPGSGALQAQLEQMAMTKGGVFGGPNQPGGYGATALQGGGVMWGVADPTQPSTAPPDTTTTPDQGNTPNKSDGGGLGGDTGERTFGNASAAGALNAFGSAPSFTGGSGTNYNQGGGGFEVKQEPQQSVQMAPGTSATLQSLMPKQSNTLDQEMFNKYRNKPNEWWA